MKVLMVVGLAFLLSVATFAQGNKYGKYCPPEPTFPGQSEAVELKALLDQAGLKVDKILRSKLESFFKGVNGAAYFKTDKGSFEVIFFPHDNAERMAVTETRDGDRYLYSFTGQPEPNPPGDEFNSSRPMYFLSHRNAFVIVWDDRGLFEELKAVLIKN